MDVLVGMQHTLNLEQLRAKGPQPEERMQPSEPSGANASQAAPAKPAGPQPSPEIVAELSAVLPGFSQNAFKRAALAVGNSDANAAMNWLLTHSEDADINNPVDTNGCGAAAGGGSGGTAANGVDGAGVSQIMEMGFSEKQARAALKAAGGGADRAVAWLFDQGDSLDAEVERLAKEAEAAATPKEPQVRFRRCLLVPFCIRLNGHCAATP